MKRKKKSLEHIGKDKQLCTVATRSFSALTSVQILE